MTRSRPIRVVIVDDDGLFAEALVAIFTVDGRVEVVGRATDGKKAVELAERLEPEVVLMDISMPVVDGFEATREIRKRVPGARVLMLTGSNSRHDVDRSRRAGAAGYVTKDRIAAELVDAILDAAGK